MRTCALRWVLFPNSCLAFASRGPHDQWPTAAVARVAPEISGHARDWDALLSMCTDDVVFSPPNEPLVEGQAVRPWLENFPPMTSMAWDIEHLESAGDLAWLRGPVRMTVEIAGQSVAFDGKYTDVCRQTPDGTWRFAVVMWSSNEAAPGGPA